MSFINLCISFILFVSISTDFTLSNDCHDGLADIRKYMGSKTPYRFVAPDSNNPIQYDGCEPVKIIGFVRHGTRTPSIKIINQMKNDLPRIRDNFLSVLKEESHTSGHDYICPEKMEELKSWKFGMEYSYDEKFLTHEGEDEMIDLATRLQKRFPNILPQEYSNKTYYFKYTATQRAQESAKYFTIGLFGRYKIDHVQYPKSLEKDPILRFYKLCDKWMKTVKKNPRALVEHFEYMIGNDMEKTCKDVSRRLGYNNTLSHDEVRLMYAACCFETAQHKQKKSPWCSVFSKSDLEVLVYGSDLKHYLIDGYGHDINHKIACPAIKHVFSHLESDDPNNSTAVFYFTHSGTILKLLSSLGLYKDPFKLTSAISKDERDQRKWTTSSIDAFGSNLIFVLYKCGNEKKVLTLHQEKPVPIGSCPSRDLCPLSTLLNNFKDTLNDCDFNKMCSVS